MYMTVDHRWNAKDRHPRLGWAVCLLCLFIIVGCAGSGERLAREQWQIEQVRANVSGVSTTDGLVDEAFGLADYLALAARNNPGIEAARQEWKAALEEAPIAGSLPDPILSYGYFIEEVETRVGPQKQRLGISQQFPWFGTLGQRRDAVLSAAEAVYHRYEATLSHLTRDVTSAYADYYILATTLEVTRGNLELLRAWERILDARYKVADADYSDLILVQVEITRLEDRLATLADRRSPQMAVLNARIGLPTGTLLPWPQEIPATEELPNVEAMEEAILESSPELLALRSMIDKEARAVTLARKSGYPDFTIGLDWIQTDPRDLDGLDEDGKDPILAKFAVRLPLWRGKVRAGIRQAEARRAGASERLEDRGRSLSSELADLRFRHDDADRKISLYRDSLIPKGEQSLEAAMTAFESGRADFLKVLDAQRVLLEFQLSLENARADRLKARAGIDALLGPRPSEG